MIGRLRGRVVSESADGTLVLDVGGVGYELLVPLGTLGRCVAEADGAVVLQVVTHVREDAITLFGFADERERAAFRLLTGVAGVGPRTAVSVLGVLPSGELAAAVARGDVRKLQSVPGVGKRIAERLALELKDKLTGLPGTAAAVRAATLSVPVSSAREPSDALAAALLGMGFKPAEAERAATALADRAAEPLDVRVRDALKLLVR